jgi:hypothetical protein
MAVQVEVRHVFKYNTLGGGIVRRAGLSKPFSAGKKAGPPLGRDVFRPPKD